MESQVVSQISEQANKLETVTSMDSARPHVSLTSRDKDPEVQRFFKITHS